MILFASQYIYFSVAIFLIYIFLNKFFNWSYILEIENLRKRIKSETSDLYTRIIYKKKISGNYLKNEKEESNEKSSDNYYTFSTNGQLYDYSENKTTSLEKIKALGENVYELMKDNFFRFRMKCNPPYVAHKDIPWHCFSNPCGKKSLYDVSNKVCICDAEYENEYFNISTSECIPEGYRQFYNNTTEILTIRSRCFNEELKNSDKIIPYPCESNSNSNVTIQGILLRFPQEKETIENEIKLFSISKH